ncbi:hypothetical protein EEY24_16540 [Shewanella algae]|nr:hypothetical protein EEY24_16540 [Shewanella algae]
MELTCEEAGLVMVWVGQCMYEQSLTAGAAIVMGAENHELLTYLTKNGVDDVRATEIERDVKTHDLIDPFIFMNN